MNYDNITKRNILDPNNIDSNQIEALTFSINNAFQIA